jgi:hypothetical protein
MQVSWNLRSYKIIHSALAVFWATLDADDPRETKTASMLKQVSEIIDAMEGADMP